MIQRITFLSILFTIVSCQNSSKSDYELLQSSEWILGNWEQQKEDGVLIEKWVKVNDSTFNGNSLFLKGKDTIHKETIILQQNGENLTYKTIIKGQNDDQPILFLAKESVENQLEFENLNNDYPQKIKYSQTNVSQLMTEISGIQQGKPAIEKYNLAKVK